VPGLGFVGRPGATLQYPRRGASPGADALDASVGAELPASALHLRGLRLAPSPWRGTVSLAGPAALPVPNPGGYSQ